jgi:hypothetical protein
MLESSTNGARAAGEVVASREDQGGVAELGVPGMTYEIGGGSPDLGP